MRSFLGYDPDSKVLELVSYAWAGFGAAFGPVIILSLFWKRMTRNGAISGIIVGALTVVIWGNLTGGIFDLYELAPGFLLGVLAIIIVSLLDKAPSAEIQNEFDQYKLRNEKELTNLLIKKELSLYCISRLAPFLFKYITPLVLI